MGFPTDTRHSSKPNDFQHYSLILCLIHLSILRFRNVLTQNSIRGKWKGFFVKTDNNKCIKKRVFWNSVITLLHKVWLCIPPIDDKWAFSFDDRGKKPPTDMCARLLSKQCQWVWLWNRLFSKVVTECDIERFRTRWTQTIRIYDVHIRFEACISIVLSHSSGSKY